MNEKLKIAAIVVTCLFLGLCAGIMLTPNIDGQAYEQKLCDANNITIQDWQFVEEVTGLKLQCCPVDAVCEY